MKTIVITAPFDGYPDGRQKRRFIRGETVAIEEGYAALLIAKGLAREPSTEDDRLVAGRKRSKP